MTGNNFHAEIVARAVELIRAGIDPHELRRQVHREHPELTAQGVERVLDIARQEIVERDRPGMHDQMTDQATADQRSDKGRGKRKKPEQRAPIDAPVLTIPEASQIVRLSRASLYRAMDDKKLRYLKYGTRRLIAREDLDTFIASLRAP
jgi:excisionase family DNA binding protein